MALKPMTIERLKVVRTAEFGAFLDAGTGQSSDDVLLHKHQQTATIHVGDEVEVMLYLDPKRRLVASMRLPSIKAGETTKAQVIGVTKDGAFVDVGAERGIFMPFAEMIGKPQKGDIVRVKLYNDKSGRLAVSMKGAEGVAAADDEKLQTLNHSADRLLRYIQKNGGYISEKLPPAFIQKNFHISKAEFKRALGHLYKRRLVDKVGNGFKLIGQEDRRDA